MKEYLAQNHINGSFYITDRHPNSIEKHCRQCNDFDKIKASWLKGDDEGKYEAILSSLNDNLDIKLTEDNCFIDHIIKSFSNAREVTRSLERREFIDSKMANKLYETMNNQEIDMLIEAKRFANLDNCSKKLVLNKQLTLK